MLVLWEVRPWPHRVGAEAGWADEMCREPVSVCAALFVVRGHGRRQRSQRAAPRVAAGLRRNRPPRPGRAPKQKLPPSDPARCQTGLLSTYISRTGLC